MTHVRRERFAAFLQVRNTSAKRKKYQLKSTFSDVFLDRYVGVVLKIKKIRTL